MPGPARHCGARNHKGPPYVPSDRSPLGVETNGNGGRLRQLVYDEADAFMLAHAMMIASNTALMCGGGLAVRRLNHYSEMFLEHAPADIKLLRRDTDLCEIVIAMESSPDWQLSWRREHEWSSDGHCTVQVGSRSWGSREWRVTREVADRIGAMVASMGSMRCVRLPDNEELLDVKSK